MSQIQDIVVAMRQNSANIRFADLKKVCDHFFGDSRRNGSHHIYKTTWPGNPRVNIQEEKDGKAKDYQVKQVLAAIDKLEQK